MTEIDRLMQLLDEDAVAFVKTPGNIDDLIAYLRKARGNYEAGIKPKKGSAEPSISGKDLLDKLGMKKTVKVDRRI